MMKKHKGRLRPIRIVAAHQLGAATGGQETFAPTTKTGNRSTSSGLTSAPGQKTGLGMT